MKTLLLLLCAFAFASCEKEDIQTPVETTNLENTVWENSEITLSFKEKGECTLTQVTSEGTTASSLKYDDRYIFSPLSRCFYISYNMISSSEMLLIFPNEPACIIRRVENGR